MFVDPHSRCRSIVRKSMDREVRTKRAALRSVVTKTRKYHDRQAFIASDFPSRVPS